MVPFVAVTVTVKFPFVEAVRLHVDDPEPPGMLVGLQPPDSPGEGNIDAERLTVLEKPYLLAKVTVNVPVLPAGVKLMLAEFMVNDVEPLI